ncbi:MAG: DUF4956 domain-containing protein [Intestinibacter sp.]|uniref:DUF4956 domain-containing protein n=1 Tax=Intestinibacter sp. TaxID=1965304 RepID=UPI003F15A479
MLESIITTTSGESFTFINAIIVLITSIVLGLIISLSYMKTNNKDRFGSNFSVTLVMLPVIIAIIILLVGNNVARAFSLAGAFSIIRFRSAPGDPKDIAYIFFTLAVGLACGMGYIGYSILFTFVLCAVMLILEKVNFGINREKTMELKIVVPEDLNFEGVFDSILNEYTNSYTVERVRTRDFGALFEITYLIKLKQDASSKDLLDKLRCKNGNLNISLTSSISESKLFI